MCARLPDESRGVTVGQLQDTFAPQPEPEVERPRQSSWTGALNRSRAALLIGSDTV
jgi:hypothetical protein